MATTGNCSICGTALPPPARTGRPREFCPGGVCAERARSRRRQAAGLLESADRQAELAQMTREGRVRMYGSADYLDRRAAEFRARAAELTAGLPGFD
jgi:hypothetical protein